MEEFLIGNELIQKELKLKQNCNKLRKKVERYEQEIIEGAKEKEKEMRKSQQRHSGEIQEKEKEIKSLKNQIDELRSGERRARDTSRGKNNEEVVNQLKAELEKEKSKTKVYTENLKVKHNPSLHFESNVF